MLRFTFTILIITILGRHQVLAYPDIKWVYNSDDFNTQVQAEENVVFILTAQNCPTCPDVLKQVVDNCAKKGDLVKCFWTDIGNSNYDNSFYASTFLNVQWIPYVGFFKEGKKIAAANQKFADKNRKNVNAGFRIFI
ncbi:uncharacterized protein LOC111064317 [Nilaparvata lugens]|uniref:Thioredoxin n=1 Tax=Nilaparvata lugens TaxID=108931 RepID=A0A220XII2_NILLU|nr:uncharacterized protein LOC111064317 [Nilaparvata lugens]ASL05019.1 thioredoxin [Nilaparvata lugens]